MKKENREEKEELRWKERLRESCNEISNTPIQCDPVSRFSEKNVGKLLKDCVRIEV